MLLPGSIRLLPTDFQLDLLNHKMMINYKPGQNKVPLGNQDFELDCTNSNYWDTLRRSIEVNIQIHTEYSEICRLRPH